MHRRLVLILLAAAAVAAPAGLAAGCGAEEAAGVDVAQAAQKTARAGNAEVEITLKIDGVGLPAPIGLRATGVSALDKPKMRMTFNLSDVLASFGAPAQDGDAELIVNGAQVYARPPKLPGLDLPGGAEWVGLDLRKVVKALGLEAAGLGDVFALDTAAQLRAMSAAKGMKRVGREKVGGVETTHLKGTLDTKDLLAALPAAKRAAAARALEKLAAGTPLPATPIDVWVDDSGIMRRMRSAQKLPGQRGLPGGRFDMTYEVVKTGVALDVSKPGKVWDATDEASGALSGLGLTGGLRRG